MHYYDVCKELEQEEAKENSFVSSVIKSCILLNNDYLVSLINSKEKLDMKVELCKAIENNLLANNKKAIELIAMQSSSTNMEALNNFYLKQENINNYYANNLLLKMTSNHPNEPGFGLMCEAFDYDLLGTSKIKMLRFYNMNLYDKMETLNKLIYKTNSFTLRKRKH